MQTRADFYVNIAKGKVLDREMYDQIERVAHGMARSRGGLFADFVERTAGADGSAHFCFATLPVRSDTPTPQPMDEGSPEARLRGVSNIAEYVSRPVETA